MSGGGEKLGGPSGGFLLGSLGSAEEQRRLQLDLQNMQPGGIIRVANAMQVSSVPVRLSQRAEVVNCDGCGAAVARHLRECDWCGRPR